MKNNNKERRILNIPEITSMRALKEDGKKVIEGYGSVFNVKSKLLYDWNVASRREEYFYEVVEPGAFDEVLSRDNIDVLLTYEHNRTELIGRFTKKNGEVIANSLELSIDDKGLKYRTEIGTSTLANDLYDMVSRGDLYESSFVFTIKEDGYRMDEDEDGIPIRFIEKIGGLYDCSLVVSGAYEETDIAVATRNVDEFISEKETDEDTSETEETNEVENDEKNELNDLIYKVKELEILKKENDIK